MSLSGLLLSPAVHDAVAMRRAGADLLELALMDARSRTLGWLALFEGVTADGVSEHLDPPLWLIGHVAWYQEYWIARHLQRRRGGGQRRQATRLASIDPTADEWYDPDAHARVARWSLPLGDTDALRSYLSETLEITLELLAKAGDRPELLAVFHQALHREDLAGESLAAVAQTIDLPAERFVQAEAQGLWRSWGSSARREPLGLGGGRWPPAQAEAAAQAWAPEAECGAQVESVPPFEIDAQPVCWAQFAEFAEDGGYDDRRWWTVAGWDWADAQGRRSPRHVAQFGGGVLARRAGRLQRLPGHQPVVNVSAHEADAWCRWAGRRLPTEAEWRLALHQGAGRGFVWGDVLEWVAGRARSLDGSAVPAGEGDRLLRGASLQGSPRLKHPDARRYAPAHHDEGFFGFRSCAI